MSIIVGTIEGKTTPFGFTLHLKSAINRTAFLFTLHENKPFVLNVLNVWNDKKGSFAQVNVIGNPPSSAFDVNCEISYASPDQIRQALGMIISPEKAMNLGLILNSDIKATPNVEKLGRVFITGKSGSGKSYTVGVLIEELMKKQIPIVIIDRHGEYSSLKVLQKENIPADEPFFKEPDHQDGFARSVIEFGDPNINPGVDLGLEYLIASSSVDLISKGQTTIINLRGMDIPIQENLVQDILMRLYKSSTLREIPPFFLFIDEAHLFAGKKLSPVVETIRLFAQEGRKFGANLVVITQKPQALDTTIRAQAGTWIIHKLTDVNDVKITINSAEGLSNNSDDEIQNLSSGEAIIVGDLALEAPIRVKVRKRYTVHGGSGFNVLDVIKNQSELKKSELVRRLQSKITPDQLDNSKNLLQGTSSGENNTIMPTLEQVQELAQIKQENEELTVKIQTLELEKSGFQVDAMNWKEKAAAEKDRADKSLHVAEDALAKLKKYQK